MGCMFDTPGTGWFDSKFLSTGEIRSRDVCFLLNVIEPNDTMTHYGGTVPGLVGVTVGRKDVAQYHTKSQFFQKPGVIFWCHHIPETAHIFAAGISKTRKLTERASRPAVSNLQPSLATETTVLPQINTPAPLLGFTLWVINTQKLITWTWSYN